MFVSFFCHPCLFFNSCVLCYNVTGEWKVGNQDGWGRYTWANGVKYTGMWKLGNPDGLGAWEDEQTKYYGEWREAQRHGKGNEFILFERKMLY